MKQKKNQRLTKKEVGTYAAKKEQQTNHILCFIFIVLFIHIFFPFFIIKI